MSAIEDKVAKMDWQDIRKVLKEAEPQTRAAGEKADPQEELLRSYFGEERFLDLLKWSKKGDEIKKKLGNVVLLPGIMGSHLTVIEKNNDEDHVWVNLWRMVKGDMERLKLSSDGKTNANGETVKADGLIAWYYALALERLQAAPFPYDWRLNVNDTADKLAKFVEEKLSDGTFDREREVHFVAHSMGGLVVRSFIRRHKDFWDKLKGRLIMLGTPNSGSFAAIQTLMGRNSLIETVAKVLPFQTKADWFRIVNSFPGLYQLCPSKLVNPEVYEKTIWEKFPDVAFDGQLQLVPKFHQDLFDSRTSTIDANRMAYIAGVGYETPSGLKVLEGSEYDFDVTLDGDGTVPHKLGLLEGVTTYYVEGTPHGSLLNNRRVLKAVADIIEKGATQELSTTKPVIINPRSAVYKPAISYETEILDTVVRRMQSDKESNQPSAKEVFEAEKILLRSVLGGKEYVDDDFDLVSAAEKPDVKPVPLDVRWIFGDITAIDTPVVIVGQYRNLPPGGAGGAVDAKIGGLISRGYEYNMLGMELGEIFTLPLNRLPHKEINKTVETVIVAGMGDLGGFSREDLRYLMMNVTLGVIGTGYDTFATVIIGASLDNFSTDHAIRNIFWGISDAVERLSENEKPKKISLILAETSEDRKKQIRKFIADENKKIEESANTKGAKQPNRYNNVEVTLNEPEEGKPITRQTGRRRQFTPTVSLLTRLSVERSLEKLIEVTEKREPGKFQIAAFTSNAAIPLREITVNDTIIEQLVDELRYSNNIVKQEKYGRLLHSFLIPEDFQSIIDTDKPLVLVLNREASTIPWEMMYFGGAGRTSNFGVDLRVSRQFGSLRASVPGAAPALNKEFKALIIADPAPEEELQLPGARREGIMLKQFFRQLQQKLRGKIDLQFQACIGYEECDIVKILELIFNEELDLIHFAGHGTFDAEDPSNSGWVFGKNLILSAKEIFRLRRVPRLVFANACFSAGLPTIESNRQLAGLAEAFFDRGIENYIGAGWQVSDEHAIGFAEKFYEKTIAEGTNIGTALSEARMKISPYHDKTILPADSTWGAYQHYGNPNTILIREPENAPKRTPRNRTAAKPKAKAKPKKKK